MKSCKQLSKDDIEYVEANTIEMNDRFYYEGNDIPVESVKQLLQSEPNRLTKSNYDTLYKSDAFTALINAVMMKR